MKRGVESGALTRPIETGALARSLKSGAPMRAAENEALQRIVARLHPAIRREFPALRRNMAGGRRVYLNNAGGTIVTRRSAAMMAHTALWANPQDGDIHDGERLTAELHAGARAAAADFLNAPSPHEIAFHLSASHALFNLSFALRDHLRPGDNLVVTRLDHAANVSPWESIWGEDRGLEVRECRVRRDGTLDLDHLWRRSRASPMPPGGRRVQPAPRGRGRRPAPAGYGTARWSSWTRSITRRTGRSMSRPWGATSWSSPATSCSAR